MKRFVFLLVLGVGPSFATAAEPVRYNRDVRAILADNCFACHGPDSANRKAGLWLDVGEGAVASRSSSDMPAIESGRPERSELISRIFSDDADLMMPPPVSHKPDRRARKRRAEDASLTNLGRTCRRALLGRADFPPVVRPNRETAVLSRRLSRRIQPEVPAI